MSNSKKALPVNSGKFNYTKVTQHEKLSPDDKKFISELGWLSALSVTVATVAASL